MDADSFIVHVKTDYIYKDIAEDVETRCWHFKLWNGSLPMGKNKQVIGLVKDELGGQIMKKLVGLRAKTCSYLKDDDEYKKAKGTQKCVYEKKS